MKEKQRFSLRKTAAGVASALLGTSLMLTSMAPVLAAEETAADAVNEPAVLVDSVAVAEAKVKVAQNNYDKAAEAFEGAVDKLATFKALIDQSDSAELKAAKDAVKASNAKVSELKEADKVAKAALEKAQSGKEKFYEDLQNQENTHAKTIVDAKEKLAAAKKAIVDAEKDFIENELPANQKTFSDKAEALSQADLEVQTAKTAVAKAKRAYDDEKAASQDGTVSAETEQAYEDAKNLLTTAEEKVTNLTTEYEDAKKALEFEVPENLTNDLNTATSELASAEEDLATDDTINAEEKARLNGLVKAYEETDFVKALHDAEAAEEKAAKALKKAEEEHVELAKTHSDALAKNKERLKANEKALVEFKKELGYEGEDDPTVEEKLRQKIADAKAEVDVASLRLELAEAELRNTQGKADGFEKKDGEWFYYENGMKKRGWHKASYGTWYFFDEKGGAMVTGWRQVNGSWYYFEDWGGMATGWKNLGGSWYYLNPSGAMATGWKKVGGSWYYLNPSGAMATGWKKVGKNWYFLLPSGAMRTEAVKIGGRVYRFAPSGALL